MKGLGPLLRIRDLPDTLQCFFVFLRSLVSQDGRLSGLQRPTMQVGRRDVRLCPGGSTSGPSAQHRGSAGVDQLF
jgi:hypothetical protein